MRLPNDIRNKYVDMINDQQWLDSKRKAQHKKKWYGIMITATVGIWTSMLAIPTTLSILCGILSAGSSNSVVSGILVLLTSICAIGAFGVLISIIYCILDDSQYFAFWFGIRGNYFFEGAFLDWYDITFNNATKEETESQKIKRLKKTEKERKEFIQFCERMINDPEFAKAYLSL